MRGKERGKFQGHGRHVMRRDGHKEIMIRIKINLCNKDGGQ